MGVLIPPSNPLILYGIITEQSIGKLFIAGIIPGILEAVFYIITIYIICRLNPNLGPRSPKVSFKEKLAPIGRCGEVVLLVVFVLGGLFIGWFTPTEAGAAGAFGSIVIALARRRLDWRKFKEACLETLRTSGMIYALIIGASIMNYFLAVSRLPTEVARVIGDLPLPPIGIMALVMSLQIVLGCFIDALAMMLILTPIFFPMAMQLGFDPIWFGIMMVVMGEIAVITPPVGINVYAISGIAKDVPMETIFRGIFPFFIADICRVALLLFVPQLALFLPSLMK
jgi:tripartite ATP-independent transporter DctM subunit